MSTCGPVSDQQFCKDALLPSDCPQRQEKWPELDLDSEAAVGQSLRRRVRLMLM